MPYGLRIWDANGNLTLDTTDRIPRYHSTITVGIIPAFSTTSFYIPNFSIDGTWFYFLIGGLPFIHMYITPNYLNLSNPFGSDFDGSGVQLELFRG